MAEENATAKNEDFNWTSGIQKISHLTHGQSVKADHNANKIISDALSSIFTVVMNNLKDKKLAQASIEDIQEAVKKLMPSSIADHAMSEGMREIFSWGAMPFDFVKRKHAVDDRFAIQLERMKKRDQEELKRSFLKGVLDVLQDSHTDAKLDKQSNVYICKLLDDVSNDMVEKLNKKKLEELTIDEARQVVREVLPKEILHHADAEGNKMLYKFESRGLEFVPGASAHQRVQDMELARAKRRKGLHMSPSEEERDFAANGVEFKSGVASILQVTHADLNFHPSGQKDICRSLNSLCAIIVAEAGKKGSMKTQEEIQKAVQSVLPPVMAEHAIAEAKKMMRSHEKGEFDDLVFQKIYKNTGLKLEDGMVAMTKMTYPKASLHESAIGSISIGVNTLLSALVNKLKDSGAKEITAENVKKVVNAVIVPPTLQAHANSEGDKMVTLYEMQKIFFTPKRRKTST